METQTCQIRWIDDNGKPTPDVNPAVVVIRCMAHNSTVSGRVIHFDASAEFRCCAEHMKLLDKPGMEYWHIVASLNTDGVAKATDGCRVEPDGTCPHGCPSWLVKLGYV